jgi:hypothetical protein
MGLLCLLGQCLSSVGADWIDNPHQGAPAFRAMHRNALQGLDNFIKAWHVRQRASVALATDLLLDGIITLYYT